MVRMKNAVHHQALTRRAGEDVLLLESVTRSLPQIALGMPTVGIRSCPIFTFHIFVPKFLEYLYLNFEGWQNCLLKKRIDHSRKVNRFQLELPIDPRLHCLHFGLILIIGSF